jgi:hypothetical protein
VLAVLLTVRVRDRQVAGHARPQRRVAPGILVPHRAFGTHAYALSRKGAEKLLRKCNKASNHVDAVNP